MPAAPCDVIANVVTATQNGADLGLTTGFRIARHVTRANIRAPGKTGFGCRPAIIDDYAIQIKHMVGPAVGLDSFGDLVINCLDGTGAPVDITIADTLEDGYEESRDRDAPEAGAYMSAFIYKGDFDADPRS